MNGEYCRSKTTTSICSLNTPRLSTTDAWRLPAEPVERAARAMLAELMRDSATVNSLLPEALHADAYVSVTRALSDLTTEIETTNASGLRSLFLDLSTHIVIAPDTVTLAISHQALAHILDIEIERVEDRLRCTRPFRIRKRGSETKVLIGELDRRDPNPAMIDLIAKGHAWAPMLLGGKSASVHDLARQLGVDRTLVSRALPLAFLAPDIIEVILVGQQPPELTVTRLKRLDPVPIRWADQRKALGFPEPIRSTGG